MLFHVVYYRIFNNGLTQPIRDGRQTSRPMKFASFLFLGESDQKKKKIHIHIHAREMHRICTIEFYMMILIMGLREKRVNFRLQSPLQSARNATAKLDTCTSQIKIDQNFPRKN